VATAALILLGYLLGSMPWGYWLPRLLRGADVRRLGSGNLGAANVWRTLGFKLALAVAFLDIAKGLSVALLADALRGELVGVLAGVAAMVGHWRPLFLRFARGGKTVATTGGVGLALALFPCLAAGVVWTTVFLVTRYTSAASMAGALSFPFLALLFGEPWPVLAFACGAAVAILLLHRGNISRLLAGTENRFELRRRGATGQRASDLRAS
jgi:glycerol-3-phosphate acyltransferase PlsY